MVEDDEKWRMRGAKTVTFKNFLLLVYNNNNNNNEDILYSTPFKQPLFFLPSVNKYITN